MMSDSNSTYAVLLVLECSSIFFLFVLHYTHCAFIAPQDGEMVTFTEVQGMPELNDGAPRRIKNCKVVL